MQLYNKLSAKERAWIIDQNSQERITLSFYKYFKIGNPSIFRDNLYIIWSKLDILGRIYVAKEGVNAQLSVPKDNFEKFKTSVNEIAPLKNIRLNVAVEHYSKSFLKLTITSGNNLGSIHFQSINSACFVFKFISFSSPKNLVINHFCFCPLYLPFQIIPTKFSGNSY